MDFVAFARLLIRDIDMMMEDVSGHLLAGMAQDYTAYRVLAARRSQLIEVRDAIVRRLDPEERDAR